LTPSSKLAQQEEFARQYEAEAKVEFALLLNDLGSDPPAVQRALAELASYSIVHCRRLRLKGNDREADAACKVLTGVLDRLAVKPTRLKA
jgi:hypothetical protein